MIFIFSVAAVYIFQLASFALSIPRLLDMYRFYTHLLGIPDVSGTLTDPLDGADTEWHRPIYRLCRGRRSCDSWAKLRSTIR
jgi:hypothetical protein